MANEKMMKLAADTVRLLSADAIQKAKSGHPGMPMGCADFAFDLWFNHMKHNPRNPNWLGRDRFVLSAGHGSMLIYSLLHLFGYGLSMDEIKQFRQWGSKTPGHPEFGHTTGVEVTTGPLGTGFASGVGMAVSAKYTAAVCGLEGTGLLDNKIYIISGDGCMMEGITHEAASFAGHQKLDNIIVFYDSNMISIEGSTEIAFTEDVGKRFEAYGWRVIKCANANDYAQVEKALEEAKKSDGRPTLIIGSTTIGFGAPNKAGKASSHGEPLGVEELAAAKKALGFPEQEFYVPQEVRDMIDARVAELEKEEAAWDAKFQQFVEANPDKAAQLSKMMNREVPANLLEELVAAAPVEKTGCDPRIQRNHSPESGGSRPCPLRRRGGPCPLHQNGSQGSPLLLAGKQSRTQLPFRCPRTRHGLYRERHGAFRRGNRIFLHLLRVLRLHETGNQARRAPEASGDLCVHARLFLRR